MIIQEIMKRLDRLENETTAMGNALRNANQDLATLRKQLGVDRGPQDDCGVATTSEPKGIPPNLIERRAW